MFNPRFVFRKGEGAPKGSELFFDSRLCFNARDNYFSCLNKQNREEPNKYLCTDDLINYETYCPPDFIYNTKQRYHLNKRNERVWTQEDLDLINFRRNHMTAMNELPNNAMFEDEDLNKRGFATINRNQAN